MKVFVVLAVSIAALPAFSKERCAQALVRTYVDGKPRVETTRLCLDDETRPGAPPEPGFLISERCVRAKYCRALAAAYELSTENAKKRKSDHFTRRFQLCKVKGGRPEVIEVQWDGKFQPSDRCVFNDHSFIDTMSLVGLGRFAPADDFKPRPSTRKASATGGDDQDRKR